jgi:hypothetical protein
MALLLSASIVACGTSETSKSDTSSTSITGPQGIYVPQNVSCEKADQNGFYEAILIRNDGNCPDFSPFLVQVTNGELSFGSGCEMQSISFTEGECVQESVVVCEKDEISVTFETALAQLEESGSILVGTTTMVRELAGETSPECSSGYRLKIERVSQN